MMELIENFQDSNQSDISKVNEKYNTMVIGINHHTALVEVREKFSMTDQVMERVSNDLKSKACIDEVAILNTCNRMEIFVASPDINEAVSIITK